jgi:Mg-chelatase subunit ChlD
MGSRPGGELASRPLHFIWIVDCSGSMSVDGKIQSLNHAIRESLPHMQDVADENPNAQVLLRTLKFSHGAEWQNSDATYLENFKWKDLVADPLQSGAADADIVFMLDTSGSMGNEIEAVKKSCMEFATHITKVGARVRLGLIGFDIGGHRGAPKSQYTVHKLSRYTIGVWPLDSPQNFTKNIQSLSLGLFGGAGCYLANQDTVDIFPHVVRMFDESHENTRILVIISDEMGNKAGLDDINSQMRGASITAHVLGVASGSGAHEAIARATGGRFWDINKSKGKHDFAELLDTVAKTIAKEMTKKLADGSTSTGTDMGKALYVVAEQLKIPPMVSRALPPVLVLISDGQPTDEFEKGLQELMAQPWGKRAARIAIAIGRDADHQVLQKFIGHSELKPLHADNPERLVKYIKWASTAVLKSASAPASQSKDLISSGGYVPIPAPPIDERPAEDGVW